MLGHVWMSNRRYATTSALLLALVLIISMQACVLHPPYRRPCLDIPDKWRLSTDESASYANYGWWEQFEDPVLDCLISEALASNNDLKVAIARVYEFVGQLLVARSALYPQISGTLEVLRQETSVALTPLFGVPRISNQYFALLNASYEIDIWGKIQSASEAALAELLASVEARRTVVLTVVSSVAGSYMRLRQLDAQLEIARKTYESRQESFKLAELRYLGGLTSELEAKQSEAEMDNAKAQVLEFELNVAQEENLLSILIGTPPQSISRGRELTAFPKLPEVPAGLPSEIVNQRPDILEAEERYAAANAALGVAAANFYPDFSLTGFYGNASIHLRNLLSSPATMWQYSLQMTQPIFTGWQLEGQYEIANSQRWQAYYTYRQVVLNAFKEVNDALVSRQQAQLLVVTQQKRVDALVVALHLANLQYENGQVDYLNVLDAQRNLFDAQLDLASAQGEVLLSIIDIYKSLGGGWVIEADIEATQSCQGN